MINQNLIIGKHSQLSRYYQAYFDSNQIEYVVVSARDIAEVENHAKSSWKEIYLCFGESRKHITDKTQYDEVNYKLTKKIIDLFTSKASAIYVYSTCELWNEYSGPITLNTAWKNTGTDYVLSKQKLVTEVLSNPSKYSNVYVQYPFNFNSPFRTKDFLFGKIFHSILHEEKTEIGNVFFYRDIIHPNFVIKQTVNSKKHQLIGSGRMIYVIDYIKDLYSAFNLDLKRFVKIDKLVSFEKKEVKEYYMESDICLYDYNTLLADTVHDLNEYKNYNLKVRII